MEVRICCKECASPLEGAVTLVCPSCHRAWDRAPSLRWAEITA